MDRIWYKSYEPGMPPTLTYPDKTVIGKALRRQLAAEELAQQSVTA